MCVRASCNLCLAVTSGPIAVNTLTSACSTTHPWAQHPCVLSLYAKHERAQSTQTTPRLRYHCAAHRTHTSTLQIFLPAAHLPMTTPSRSSRLSTRSGTPAVQATIRQQATEVARRHQHTNTLCWWRHESLLHRQGATATSFRRHLRQQGQEKQ